MAAHFSMLNHQMQLLQRKDLNRIRKLFKFETASFQLYDDGTSHNPHAPPKLILFHKGCWYDLSMTSFVGDCVNSKKIIEVADAQNDSRYELLSNQFFSKIDDSLIILEKDK